MHAWYQRAKALYLLHLYRELRPAVVSISPFDQSTTICALHVNIKLTTIQMSPLFSFHFFFFFLYIIAHTKERAKGGSKRRKVVESTWKKYRMAVAV
jgi:hypothetical protein